MRCPNLRRPWVTSRQYKGQPVLDVAIVGGGQSGLSITFGLMRENVTNIRLYDHNRPGEAGPWTSDARMQTLRTYDDPELRLHSPRTTGSRPGIRALPTGSSLGRNATCRPRPRAGARRG